MTTYSKDGPFNDPVVRCDSCQTLLLVKILKEDGQCLRCGNTKVRNLRGRLIVKDCETLISWRNAGIVDPEFVALFVVEGRDA